MAMGDVNAASEQVEYDEVPRGGGAAYEQLQPASLPIPVGKTQYSQLEPGSPDGRHASTGYVNVDLVRDRCNRNYENSPIQPYYAC